MPLAITPTFSPWTHTSDDSYIYQLSLVLATATVSFLVSLHVVGIESEYFVYTRYHTYVCEMNLVCAYHIIVYPVQHVCLS